MEATRIGPVNPDSRGDQVLWRLNEPYAVDKGWGDEPNIVATVTHVVTSAIDAPFTGPETYVFPADEHGVIVDWGELPGSYRGGFDHQRAIDAFVACGGRDR